MSKHNLWLPSPLRRQLIANHLTFCCASLVFCPFVRNRQFYSAHVKRLFKRIARTGEKVFPETADG